MYKEFYHLKENPFNITADPDFFFSSVQHKEAITHLTYGIQQRKGIIAITGEIGTGKTTLCRTVLGQLDESTKTALILNPNFSDLQLLRLILQDLGIETPAKTKYEMVDALNEFLLTQSSEGNNVVVIIDEAQNLKVNQLEQVRLLSNLETEKDKLLQIVLVGQPELVDKLKLKSLRQLNQRIAVRFHIGSLTKDEIREYIRHRLNVAQGEDFIRYKIHFTEAAVDTIFAISKGTPRMVNILCDRALLAGYAAETFTIDEQIIHTCSREVGQK